MTQKWQNYGLFQHTAARRRLDRLVKKSNPSFCSFNTQPPEGGWEARQKLRQMQDVSTHSRPKAAGSACTKSSLPKPFQHTAARRRLARPRADTGLGADVSTHSRPKAAGNRPNHRRRHQTFQHTAARRRLGEAVSVPPRQFVVSTHSRPKAAGTIKPGTLRLTWFQHTAARRRLVSGVCRWL